MGENSERPPRANIDRCDQEQNARNQRANDGEAQENQGDHPSFRATVVPKRLHDSLPETFVFTRQQRLRQIVPSAVGIARSSGKMMVDSHFGRATEIARH